MAKLSIIIILMLPTFSLQSPYIPPEIQRCSRAFLTVSSLWRPQSYSNRFEAETEVELNWETNCNESNYIDSVALFREHPGNKGAVPLIHLPTKQYPGYFRTNITLGNTTLPGGWQLEEEEEKDVHKDQNKKSDEDSEFSIEEDEESEAEKEEQLKVRRENRRYDDSPIKGDHCLPFWIAAYRNKTLTYIDCLKIRPTWIWDHRADLGDMSLRSLFIPGTHNSGCYKKLTGLNNQSARRNSFASRFLLTQDLDVYAQLVYGIRYLDIRVGYYPSTPEQFWVNHDVSRLVPLRHVLQSVKQFLKRSPDPLILDFHRFPVGFTERRRGRRKQHKGVTPAHRLLVDLLWSELALNSIIADIETGEFSPADASVPLNTLWKSGRRLLVSYADKASREEFPWLRGEVGNVAEKSKETIWTHRPSVIVIQEWGNVQNSSQLYEFLSRTVERRKKLWGPSMKSGTGDLWAAMAELTPTPMDVVFSRPGSGLRRMAHDVNRNVTRWFRDLWWQSANIVATDFFRGTNIVDVAVEANLRRSHI